MKNYKLISIILGAVIVAVIGSFVFWQKINSFEESADTADMEKGANISSTDAASPEKKGILVTEVSAHNSRETCWSVINGSVYDLTSWIPKHPGGEKAILGLCGNDGSEKFNKKHGGMAQQEAILLGFKIGTAVQSLQ